jgi:hypothetical protein
MTTTNHFGKPPHFDVTNYDYWKKDVSPSQGNE